MDLSQPIQNLDPNSVGVMVPNNENSKITEQLHEKEQAIGQEHKGWFGSKFIEVMDCSLSHKQKLAFFKQIEGFSSSSDGEKESSDEISNSFSSASTSDSNSNNNSGKGLTAFVRKFSSNVKKSINPNPQVNQSTTNIKSSIIPLSRSQVQEKGKEHGSCGVSGRQQRLSLSLIGAPTNPIMSELSRSGSKKGLKRSNRVALDKPNQTLDAVQLPPTSPVVDTFSAPCSTLSFIIPHQIDHNPEPTSLPKGKKIRKPKTPYPSISLRPQLERSLSTTQLYAKFQQVQPPTPSPPPSPLPKSSFEVLNRRSKFQHPIRVNKPNPTLIKKNSEIPSPDAYTLNFHNFKPTRFNYQHRSSFLGRDDEDEEEEDEYEADCSNDRSRQLDSVWWTNSP